MKTSKTQYCIKSCPSDDSEQLQLLLNTMSDEGWELYTMHEAEDENEGYQFNCIFVKEIFPEEVTKSYSDYYGFTTKMERIMSAKQDPLDLCLDIQKKIKEQRAKIAKIKSKLDSTSEDSRNELNQEISVNIEILENLKKKLFNYLTPDIMYGKIHVDKLSIMLSEELTELVNPDTEINLLSKIVQVRQNLTEQLGYVIPEVKPKSDDCLQGNEFIINVRGTQAIKSACYPGYIMYFKDELNTVKLPKNTVKDTDPITGKKIVWIEEEKTKDYWLEGLDSNEYIARLLEYTAVKYVDEILDYGDINKYIEIVAIENLYLIENIIPDFISIGELKYLIANLIKERVSVKDIVYVFEKINDLSSEPTKEELLSAIRRSFARQITASRVSSKGSIYVIEISEKSLNDINGKKSEDNTIKIEGGKIEKIVKRIKEKAEENKLSIKDISIVLPSNIRQIGFVILSKFLSEVTVISREELTNDYPINLIGTV